MNIWDSVHRGLEKASQEAGRIARIQRLRTAADGLSRQMQGQHSLIVDRLMELFVSGRLAQPEMVALCQELVNMQQQMAQIQQELKQLQSTSGTTGQTGLPTNGGESLPPAPVPPPPTYQPAAEYTIPIPPPPPPDADSVTVSGMETMLNTVQVESSDVPVNAPRYCRSCRAELLTGHAFCHQCGTPVEETDAAQPTIRSGFEPIPSEETIMPRDVEG